MPKANGKLRPLGISTLRDRVCMTAAMLVLEPIFEADLPPEQYAYRPGRNAQPAVVEVEELLFRGHPEVVDADLADYFGSIPHAELLKSVARRIVDRRVLHLIKMWLECPVEETDDRGRKTRTTEARDSRRGIPQGSPISPLLANLYMRRFVLGWKMLGLEHNLGSRIVTYADDLVILCRRPADTEQHERARSCQILQDQRSVAGREKLIEEVTEPGFEHVDLSLGDRHLVGPVVGDGPCGRIRLRRPANTTRGRGRVVVEVVAQSDLRRGLRCSGFALASHARNLAPDLGQKNGRSARNTTLPRVRPSRDWSEFAHTIPYLLG
jgi:hypothetical protein